jgi:hypothetical protein
LNGVTYAAFVGFIMGFVFLHPADDFAIQLVSPGGSYFNHNGFVHFVAGDNTG